MTSLMRDKISQEKISHEISLMIYIYLVRDKIYCMRDEMMRSHEAYLMRDKRDLTIEEILHKISQEIDLERYDITRDMIS